MKMIAHTYVIPCSDEVPIKVSSLVDALSLCEKGEVDKVIIQKCKLTVIVKDPSNKVSGPMTSLQYNQLIEATTTLDGSEEKTVIWSDLIKSKNDSDKKCYECIVGTFNFD